MIINKKISIAVVGGGINGICVAWRLAELGASVHLYEKNKVLRQTSSSSSKLLHGGLRYIENLEFGMVYEALKERSWWISNVPEYAKLIKIYIPIYKDYKRKSWKYELGLSMYDSLALIKRPYRYKKLKKDLFILENPEIRRDGLVGGFFFYDGMMDDYSLGLWVVGESIKCGVKIYENYEVLTFDINGDVLYKTKYGEHKKRKYDFVINATGPWVEDLMSKSGIKSDINLMCVRGSHIVINRGIKNGYLLEAIDDKRIFFVLPYNGKTLVGTTEVLHDIHKEIAPDENEINLLMLSYSRYFSPINKSDIIHMYSGVRPIVQSSLEMSSASREYKIKKFGNVIAIYGGKWTTARSLARKVSAIIYN